MSREYRAVSKLLALGQESFEDEVRRLGISTEHLSPMQVLAAIQHAELRLNYTFTPEDFHQGKVGAKMIPDNFRFDENQPKLLEERQKAFQEELKTMSGVLKAQFEAAQKEYKDLLADTPVLDLHKLADFDMKKLPKLEATRERLLCNMQEWMLSKKSSNECAVLPEDKLQRLLVGACNQLKIACYVEQTALQIRYDAVRVMKAALTGTATTKLLDVLEAAFGIDEKEEDIPDIQPTEGEEETEELPEPL